jgi:hypothetical protein
MLDKQNIGSICILILPIVALVVIAEVIDVRLFSRIATILRNLRLTIFWNP